MQILIETSNTELSGPDVCKESYRWPFSVVPVLEYYGVRVGALDKSPVVEKVGNLYTTKGWNSLCIYCVRPAALIYRTDLPASTILPHRLKPIVWTFTVKLLPIQGKPKKTASFEAAATSKSN